MKRGSLHSKRGMSLVEPLVAMVVLSFSLLGSVSMFALAQDGITVGARKLQAMALAETRIERLRVADYHTLLTAGLDGDGIVDVGLKDSGSEGEVVAVEGGYTTGKAGTAIIVSGTAGRNRPGWANSQPGRIRGPLPGPTQQGRL